MLKKKKLLKFDQNTIGERNANAATGHVDFLKI